MLTGTVSQNLKTRTIINTNLIQTNLKDNDVIIGRSYEILAAGLARNIKKVWLNLNETDDVIMI